MGVSINELEKSILALDIALNAEKTDLNRDASIQRFEFVIELSWKTAKKIMGTSSSAPKDIIREMARNDLIDDTEIWFKAIEMRNLSSHTYNESTAEEVYQFSLKFIQSAKVLCSLLKKK